MGKKSWKAVQKAFVPETEQAMAFLVDEFTLAGPELRHLVLTSVTYTAGDVSYRIMLADDENSVLTAIGLDLGHVRLVAHLEDVWWAAGFGARNDVPQSAQSLRSLTRTLKRQAEMLRRLHPLLSPPAASRSDAERLLRTAEAREWSHA